ncbi:MAG: 23S rRNA (adenine(2503)-C(2))-methyltransferase RlmN [Desulfitobacterium sp.]|nr:23S rRNA (adenine(2503)-C(2))-methyltransferase RlmN [Desulfitobacterium sp.]
MDCRDLELEELNQICSELGLPRFRGGQLFHWVQKKAVQSWNEMTNIGKAERQKLAQVLILEPLTLLKVEISRDGTRKFLFRCHDGETIESVLMDYDREKSRDRRTICVSTQIGCAVGCAFCATGITGLKRNLSTGEIVGQVLDITYAMIQEDPDFHVTNVVFMGMGEPLLNYEKVLKAIQLLNHAKGQGIGMRRMTISTSGVAPKIRQLAVDNPQVGLAVSLHSGNDRQRNELVPMNRRYPLAELMSACQEYTEITNRRITYEIALIADQAHQKAAEEVGKLLKGQLAHVNLIPVNPVAETGMERPKDKEIETYGQVLEKMGISVTIREEKGTDINGACGQLRRQMECE